MEREFRRDIGSLAEIFEFIRESLRADQIESDPDLVFWVDMLVEELFTNLVKYGGAGDRGVVIGLSREDGLLVIRVTGFETEEFDITCAPGVDTSAPLSGRRPGGLGLHLVKCVADDVSYEYRDRISTITVTKRLEDVGA